MTQFGNLNPDEQPPLEYVDTSVTISNLQEQIARLSAQVDSLASLRYGPSDVIQSAPKVKLPDKFTGDRKKFRGFMVQLQLVFSTRARDYHSDSIKIATFGTLLEGKALNWFLPLTERNLLNSMTWKEFAELANATYGDPCSKLSAESKLMNLTQKGSNTISNKHVTCSFISAISASDENAPRFVFQ